MSKDKINWNMEAGGNANVGRYFGGPSSAVSVTDNVSNNSFSNCTVTIPVTINVLQPKGDDNKENKPN